MNVAPSVTVPEATSSERSGGPLVAVCALCGGAGASTLTALLAADAARRSEAPVLACDAGGATGGLALYLGASSPRSLGEVADALAVGGTLVGGLFAEAPSDVRVIATPPRFAAEGDAQTIDRVLTDASAAHGLTVVDCGTLTRLGERRALALATDIVWVLPASTSGVRRASALVDDLGVVAEGREIVVARHEHGGRRAPLRDLSRLAESRQAPLVLMPRVPDLATSRLSEGLAAGAVALEALSGVLSRRR